MYPKSLAVLGRSLAGALTAAVLLAHPGAASAQTLPAQAVSEFLANPNTLLANNPNGGSQLVSAVRDLVLADPATLASIISLLNNANPAQQSAIGTGLGQAALASVQNNPSLANQIQEAIAAANVQVATAAYSSTTGNAVTAAGSPGAGGGGGGGGGGIGGSINTAFPTGGGGSPSGSGSTAAGGTGTGGSSGLTGGGTVGRGSSTTTTTVGGSVSPN